MALNNTPSSPVGDYEQEDRTYDDIDLVYARGNLPIVGAGLKKEDQRHKYEDVDLEFGGVNVMLGSMLQRTTPPELPAGHPTLEKREKERSVRKKEEEGHKYVDVDLEYGIGNVFLGSGFQRAAPPDLPPRNPAQGGKQEVQRGTPPELPPGHPTVQEKHKERKGNKKEEESHQYVDVDLEYGFGNVILGSGFHRAAPPDLPPRNSNQTAKEKKQAEGKPEEERHQYVDADLEYGFGNVIPGSGFQRDTPPELPPGHPTRGEKEQKKAGRKDKEEDHQKEDTAEEEHTKDVDVEHVSGQGSGAAAAETPTRHIDMGDHVIVWPEQKEGSEQQNKPEETTGDEEGDGRSFAAKARGKFRCSECDQYIPEGSSWSKTGLNPMCSKDPPEPFTQAFPVRKGLSEGLRRIFAAHGIKTCFRPTRTLRNILVAPKDKTSKESKCGVVYHIQCQGQTSKGPLSLDKIRILDSEPDIFARGIKEAIYIRALQPSLNRDGGATDFLQPMTHCSRSHVCYLRDVTEAVDYRAMEMFNQMKQAGRKKKEDDHTNEDTAEEDHTQDVDVEHVSGLGSGAAAADTTTGNLDMGDPHVIVWPEQEEGSEQQNKPEETTAEGGGDGRSFAAKARGPLVVFALAGDVCGVVLESRWETKAAELQRYADENNTRKFFAGLKAIYGSSYNAMAPVRSADGTLLTEKSEITERWRKHFSQLLNRPSNIDQQAIQDMPQRPLMTFLDDPPSQEEIQKAIKQLQGGKAPGPDGIPPEILKVGGEVVTARLTELLQMFWEKGSVPQDFKDANIIHLYKNKVDRVSCDNHRGISLLSAAGKVMARIVLNRITQHLLDDESQCGFRSNRGNIDMIFTLRQIQEKCREQNQNLYILFVDLTKAFDTVSREGLWCILSKLGCPSKFVSIIRSFHDGMMARVVGNGTVSDPFPITNGVKQGCVMAPTLFSLMFATMLFKALSATDAGITVRYRCDGRVFDLRRLKAKTKVLEALVRDFLFADDCALAVLSEPDLQELASCLSTARLSLPAPHIVIEGTELNNVESFTYLGSTLTSSCSMDNKVSNRIAKTGASFGRLWTRLWGERGIRLQTKLAVYKTIRQLSLPTPAPTSYAQYAEVPVPQHLGCDHT
ncbi:hypothetical protein Bbelb_055710 [Branchiostoma belcheri]|nr:hypothetical protein Bbelb_055710 [Branchiostoma belcheri]